MHQETEETDYFFVIRSKKDHTQFFQMFNDTGLDMTTDISEAFTEGNASRLFFMLEEYSRRFGKKHEVVRIDMKKTIAYDVSDAKKELSDWKAGR